MVIIKLHSNQKGSFTLSVHKAILSTLKFQRNSSSQTNLVPKRPVEAVIKYSLWTPICTAANKIIAIKSCIAKIV